MSDGIYSDPVWGLPYLLFGLFGLPALTISGLIAVVLLFRKLTGFLNDRYPGPSSQHPAIRREGGRGED